MHALLILTIVSLGHTTSAYIPVHTMSECQHRRAIIMRDARQPAEARVSARCARQPLPKPGQ